MISTLQIESQKQAMRAQARAKRRNIRTDIREHSADVVANIDLDLLGAPPGPLAAYFPVRSELDTLPLLRRLVREGWELALPVIVDNEPLEFHEWTFGAPMQTGPFGIPQPVGSALVSPSVLLVPLLAFDKRCYRLGYGGGHYDRTLAALRKERSIVGIGLAFNEQEVEEVPACPYDERLDWILTPSGPVRAKDTE
jgi:5-formyltetrahydrofolate cyclo-ligase